MGKKRLIDLLLGIVGALALALLLPLGLQADGEQQSLKITVYGPRPAQHAATVVRLPPVQVTPSSLLSRLQPAGEPDWTEAGLAFRRWRVEYGHRWQREITLPLLLGPLEQEGTPSCGFALRLSPRLFAPGATKALAAMAQRELAKQFPLTIPCGLVKRVTLPKLQSAQLLLTPRQGYFDVGLVGVLADGTRVGAVSSITLDADAKGQLVVRRRGRIQPLFIGPGRNECEGTLEVWAYNLWRRYIEKETESIVIAEARRQITTQVQPVLSLLNASLAKLHEPWSLLPDRPEDRFVLHLQRPPRVSPTGIVFDLCCSVQLQQPRVGSLRGSPQVAAAPIVMNKAPTASATIELYANAMGINQLIYVLWQTGQLGRWGRSSLLLDRLPEHVRALAFEVEGFVPQLPPVLLPHSLASASQAEGPSPRGWLPLRTANVYLGRWGERNVLAHADVGVRIYTNSTGVMLGGRIGQPYVNCATLRDEAGHHSGAWELTPCLSDLLPALRESIIDQRPSFALDLRPLLEAISSRGLQGLRLQLGELSAESMANPPQLHATVEARIVSIP